MYLKVIMLLIRVISDIKVNYKYISDLDKMFHTKQLKDGEYNTDNYFSNDDSDVTYIIRVSIRVIITLV